MSDNKFDPEIVRQLAEVLQETNLNEIKYEINGVKIEIARHNQATVLSPMLAPTTLPHPLMPVSEPADSEPVDPALHPGAVKSPMVGNVYLAPEPGAAPFIQENDPVVEGQTLLIIEAMKVMNPIKAPRSGIIKKILTHNAAPVEFDEVLVILE